MKRRIYETVLVIGLAGVAVFGLVRFWPQPPLDSAPTSPAALPARVVCYGYVDSQQGPLLLQPARSGRVIQVFVRENQPVSKDTPLLQLDDSLVELQEQEALLGVEAARLQLTKAASGVKQSQAKLAQAEAALEAANSKVLEAQHALTRREELVKDHLANPVEADIGRAQLSGARALAKAEQNRLGEVKAVDPELEVKLAQLQLNRSEAQLERARKERKEYLLQSPINGLVLRIQAQEGDLVGPASPRPAVWLAPADAWIVRAEVPQEFAARVAEGLNVDVEDEASGRLLAKGKVAGLSSWFLPRRQLSALPTSINTGLTLECLIDLKERHGQLRLGQRVRMRVLADRAGPESP